ncbi:hypothetical protein H2200_011687 [Cladophialophora chaetospira]|uniref:Uncharacterized protein n=1 Tax=Cladophialophora chaetospira TaxID=386627 RepID=A0AA39CCS5_9EURO|nr:hypothetical protein H2200_011687 [Cladophialophora chaetospira]
MPRTPSRTGRSSTPADTGAAGTRSTQLRTVPERPSSDFLRQFAFVEGLKSKAERKKTRSWVTTQHYRRKRFEQSKAKEEDVEFEGKGQRRSTPSSRPGGSARSDDDRPPLAAEKGCAQSWLAMTEINGTSFLQRLLGSGRADPFNSYPVEATRDVHELVDHFYFVIPSLIHTYWQRAARRPRACWDLFNLYRMHEIPFLGMLHHAAHHLASMRGKHDSLQIIEFKQRSLAAVNRSLQRLEGPCDDWTLIGVGLLANAERVWGDRGIARMHWGALKRLLLERGGFPGVQHNPSMHTKLVWSFIALSWPTADGNPAYVDSFAEHTIAAPDSSVPDSPDAFRHSCEEFARFFNIRKNQVLGTLPSTPAQQKGLKTHHYRTTMFQEGSELQNALSNHEIGYKNPDKRRALDNCRMACLIHLNLIMADYGDFSTATEEFLRDLQEILDKDDDDSSLSAEHLLWTLLAAFPPKDHYERIWRMCRLVGVAKRTRAHTWIAIENALLAFLRLPDTIDGLEAVVSGWNREEFLKEVQRIDEAGSMAASFHQEYGREIPCSEGCQICPLKPTTF